MRNRAQRPNRAVPVETSKTGRKISHKSAGEKRTSIILPVNQRAANSVPRLFGFGRGVQNIRRPDANIRRTN